MNLRPTGSQVMSNFPGVWVKVTVPYTVNPLLSPQGGLFISGRFEGGLIESGAYLI